MPTILDVAKRAGVAPMTVSRVINNSGYVSAKTRKRVEAAIAELQYVPNSLARSLRSKQTKTIALVVTDITNPFFTTIARGVEDFASQYGFNVFFCNTDESDAKQREYLKILLQKQVDGILLVPARSSDESVKLVRQQGVEMVVLDRRVHYAEVDSIRCDSVDGAYQLTQHLMNLGHRRIAVLAGPQDVSTAADRVTGYEQAYREAGLEIDKSLIFYGDFNQTSAYKQMRQVLKMSPRPTAIFATNNFIALGVMQAIRQGGFRVPEDLSLASFDDLPANFVIEPFLTVATQPSYDIGQRAAELLLARLADTSKEYQKVILPIELIIRQSSGPPLKP